ncbi:MAG: ankyrin repeat domain-containing protein [Candidatus Abyssobacteria bacterium SURF_5]|uniref:Ankyrin repeat domain-containing protein n=1 Tax=Abyssobacteria bacterium (strain SURF_5) TaxID=2093360 RepID=A0A3A4N438_ABYX5|nr:MAG: ankyrin repeat domain-containing protein [Candidatus Abyssubacteria bacterium SURF_5]
MTSIIAPLKALLRKVRALLNNVNAKDECGRTALMKAAYNGSADAVKALLNNGADVNARDPWDVTALTMATAQGRNEIVQLLKKAGAKK